MKIGGMWNIGKNIYSRVTTSNRLANDFKSKWMKNPKDVTGQDLVDALDDIVKVTKGHPNNRKKAFETVINAFNNLDEETKTKIMQETKDKSVIDKYLKKKHQYF